MQSDRPLKSLIEDSLNRNSFVTELKEKILNWNDKEGGLVLSLAGDWGQGKTTILNFLKELLSNSKSEHELIVVEFNAWTFSNKKNINAYVIEAITASLGSDYEALSKLFQKLQVFFTEGQKISGGLNDFIVKTSPIVVGFGLIAANGFIFSGVEFLAIALPLAAIVFLCASWIMRLVQKYLIPNKLLSVDVVELKKDLSKEIIKRNLKIVFLIDDIDRLQPQHVYDIFKIVHLHLDLPNTIFLLSFDRKVVSHIFDSYGMNGDGYLDKVIDFQINIPEPSSEEFEQFIISEFNKVFRFYGEDNWNIERWKELYRNGLGDLLIKNKNPRAVKKPINDILSVSEGMKLEVNPFDYIGIQTLKHFYPDTYREISRNKALFTYNSISYRSNNTKIDKIKSIITSVDENCSKLIDQLFPNLRAITGNHRFGDNSLKEWDSEKRICSEDYFDRYFSFAIRGDDFSVLEVQELFKTTGSIRENYTKVLNDKNKNVGLFMRRVIQNISSAPSDLSFAKEFVTSTLDIHDIYIEREPQHGFDFDSGDTRLMRVVFFYLDIQDKNFPYFEVLKHAVKNTKDIFAAIKMVSLYSNDRGSVRDSIIVNEQELQELKQILVERIETLSYDHILQFPDLHYIIYRWDDWKKNSKKLNQFLTWIKEDVSRKATIINKFKSRVYSTVQDYDQIHYDSIEKFLGDPEILKQEMKLYIQSERISTDLLEGVKLFINNFNKRADQNPND